MQGLVTLDFGNTNPHAGLFQKNNQKWELLKVVPLDELPIFLTQLEMTANNTSVVLSQVKEREDVISNLQAQGFLITRVKDYWRGNRFAGMPVQYAQTLGEDRLIEAFYTFKTDKTSTLIIDAGTFVTMDVVTSEGFLGGYIIPGMKTYLETFSAGEQLKEISLEVTHKTELPQCSSDAMAQSYLAFAALAKDLISQHGIKKIILTGGLSTLWEGFFTSEKKTMIVEVHPNLVHSALQYWMTTQIELL